MDRERPGDVPECAATRLPLGIPDRRVGVLNSGGGAVAISTRDTFNVSDPHDATLLALLETCRRDHHGWINGDGAPYALPEDGTIMGAVGGYARGGQETLKRQVTVARQWISGEGTVEFVNGAVFGEIAWIAMIERASVNISGQSTTRRWDLRVTEIFRRTGEGWERVHRQADPLVDRHDLVRLLELQDRTA